MDRNIGKKVEQTERRDESRMVPPDGIGTIGRGATGWNQPQAPGPQVAGRTLPPLYMPVFAISCAIFKKNLRRA